MNKKRLAIILVTLLVTVSIVLWLWLPLDEWRWLKGSVSGFSLLLMLVCARWWYRHKSTKDAGLHEQQVLIKQDIRLIKQLFSQATKKIWGQGSNQLESFYDLPWYLLIGDEKSTNTEFLEQNGLEPVIKHHLDEGDTEQYLRFWSNDHLVVIEVGTCLFDDEGIDEILWRVLSKQLFKYRPRQGLNGIVSVVACERLLLGARNDRQKLASLYQEAALTISSTLKVNVPVYCMLSKVCAISDFAPFFESFSSHDLDKPFGITFSCDASQRFDKSQFEQQSKQLLSSLGELQFELLRNINANKSSAVMALPYQLRIFLDRVTEWLADIGRENRVRDAVWIRGIYLLSTSQKNAEYDLLTQLVAEKADFNSYCIGDPQSGRRSFFSSNLFSQIILPEKKITGVNKWQHGGYLFSRSLLLLLVIGVISYLGFGLKNNWNQDEHWRAEALTQLRLYNNDMVRLKRNYSISDAIALLNELRVVAETGIAPKPWYRLVSINQTKTARRIYDAYQAQLRLILLPKVAELISNELYVYVNLGNPSKIFESLRYYQMLFNNQQLDVEELQSYLRDNLQDQGDTSLENIQMFSMLVDDLFSSDYDHALQANKELIAVAISNLEGLSPERLIYARIKSMPKYFSQVDLRRQLGDKFDTFFSFSEGFHGYLIPEIFTKKGYREIDLSVKSGLLRGQLQELKAIYGDVSSVSITELADLSKQIQRLYFADYIYYWKDLISNIQVRQFATLNAFAFALKNAREPSTSPILDVLGALVINTTLAQEKKTDTDGAKKAAKLLGLGAVGKVINKVNKVNRLAGDKLLRLQPSFVVNDAFSSFSHYVNGNDTDKKSPLDDLILQFDSLNIYMEGAISSLDPGKTFHRYALAHAKGSLDTIVEFQRIGSKAPDLIGLWAKSISSQAWRQVVNGTGSYIHDQWNSSVYQFYIAAIEGRFPFTPLGRGEVTLDDFIHFFKPQGRLDQFVDQYLKPFVYWDNGVLKLNEVEGMQLAVSNSTLQQMQRARKISQIFFGPTGQELRLSLALKASSMSTKITEFQLREAENVFVYKHGPRLWTNMDWPTIGIDGYLSASVYQGKNRVGIKSYSGPWALFRMLFDGDSSATNQRFVRKLNYKLGDKRIVLDYTLRDSNLEIDAALFSQFNLPKRL